MLSKTSIVILGILSSENMSAYDILKRIEHMEMKYWWPIGDTTLYETAVRLEKKNYITGTKQNTKLIYSITDTGRSELAKTIRAIYLRVDYDTIWFSLALMFSKILDAKELAELTQKRHALLQEYANGILENLNQHKDNPRVPQTAILTMERMLAITELELQLLNNAK